MQIRGSWAGYAAAAWAGVFAVLHAVWAAGWYVGLDQELARRAFRQRWFLIYDLVVVSLCVLALGVALALVRPWGLRLPKRLLGTLAWCGTAVLVLRGSARSSQTAYLLATGRSVRAVFWFWEAWFCLGALLFGLSTWRFGRAANAASPSASRSAGTDPQS